jgi:hypothetical protein
LQLIEFALPWSGGKTKLSRRLTRMTQIRISNQLKKPRLRSLLICVIRVNLRLILSLFTASPGLAKRFQIARLWV